MGNSIHAEVKENIINKLQKEDFDHIIENDEDFYYIAGQCTKYMLNKYSRQFKWLRGNSAIKFILTSKDAIKLKENLKRMLIGKCSNLIYMDKDIKFNNAFANLITYIPDSNIINKDLLQLGYMENNIL